MAPIQICTKVGPQFWFTILKPGFALTLLCNVSSFNSEKCQKDPFVAIYGTAIYGVPTYGGATQPLVRQAVEGSGFAVALRVNDGGETAPYSLKGFQLEYQLGARR